MTSARSRRLAGPRSRRSAAWLLPRLAAATLAVASISAARPLLADSTVYRGGPSLGGYYPDKVDLPLTLDWRYSTDLAPFNPSSPAIVGKTVYFSGGSRIFALDATSGAMKWRYPEDQPMSSFITSSPAVVDGTAFFGALDGKLHALSATTGKSQWVFDTRSTIGSSPTVVDNVVYFGSGDGVLWALDAKTGSPVTNWKDGCKVSDEITGAPAVANGFVYALSLDQQLHAIGVATGKERWSFRFPMTVLNQMPVIADNYLYVANGSNLHCLITNTGNVRWIRNLASDIVAPPAVDADYVYAITSDGHVHCYEQRTGKSRWKVEPKLDYDTSAPPTICGNTILIGTAQGGVFGIDAASGAIKWTYVLQPATNNMQAIPAHSNIAAAPVVADGTVYIQADDSLAAFRADAVDTAPPAITDIEPDPGIVTNGTPPIHFEAKVVDVGSGVDPASVKMALDGSTLARRPLGPEGEDKPGVRYDPATTVIDYDTPRPAGASTVVPLADGQHTVTVSAADWRGNTAKKSWSFTVDNTIAKTYVRKSQRNQQNQPGRGPGGFGGPGGGSGGPGGFGGKGG